MRKYLKKQGHFFSGKYSVCVLLKELAIMKISYLENVDSVKSEIAKKQSAIFKAFDILT
jgi:hypothetical protein